MGETLLYVSFCLAIAGIIAISFFIDDLDGFWPAKREKGKYVPKRRITAADHYIPTDVSEIKARANVEKTPEQAEVTEQTGEEEPSSSTYGQQSGMAGGSLLSATEGKRKKEGASQPTWPKL